MSLPLCPKCERTLTPYRHDPSWWVCLPTFHTVLRAPLGEGEE